MPSHPPRGKVPPELALIDRDRCTACQACIEVCPVDCIALVNPAGDLPGLDRWCEVDLDRCIGCRLCIRLPRPQGDPYVLAVCPWEAIRMVPRDALGGDGRGKG